MVTTVPVRLTYRLVWLSTLKISAPAPTLTDQTSPGAWARADGAMNQLSKPRTAGMNHLNRRAEKTRLFIKPFLKMNVAEPTPPRLRCQVLKTGIMMRLRDKAATGR